MLCSTQWRIEDFLGEKGYDSRMGARPLSRKIDELIRVPLSKKILFDRLEDCALTVDVVDGEIQIQKQVDAAGAGVDSEGYIVLG